MSMVSSFFMEHGVEIASLPPLSNTSSDVQSYWHCLHSMRQGLCNGTVSVRLSFCPSIRPLHAAAASLLLRATPELSMGPFRVTQPNPTHQLTDPTQPDPIQVEKFGPNTTQPNPIQLTMELTVW